MGEVLHLPSAESGIGSGVVTNHNRRGEGKESCLEQKASLKVPSSEGPSQPESLSLRKGPREINGFILLFLPPFAKPNWKQEDMDACGCTTYSPASGASL